MGQKRILVVDDAHIFSAVLKRLLEAAGHRVQTVESGSAAIDHLSRHRVDVVLTDISVPEMDGLGVIRHLRGLTPAIGVIAVSGGGDAHLAKARELGVRWAFAKPLDFGDLIGAIEECPTPAWA